MVEIHPIPNNINDVHQRVPNSHSYIHTQMWEAGPIDVPVLRAGSRSKQAGKF